MPYRRLPNTDQARLRAMLAAKKGSTGLSPSELPIAQKTFLEVQAFLPQYQQAIEQYNSSRIRQAEVGKGLIEKFRMSRLYLSHFVQVLNFCIQRNELKPSVRTYLGLNEDEKSIPEMGTEQHLVEWGDLIIKGEEKRMATGGTRIYNPSIAIVKVKYEQFLEAYNSHKSLLISTERYHDKVLEMRNKADQLILNIWNEIETAFDYLPSDIKRSKCEAFGVIYFLRKNEKEEMVS